MAKILIAEDDKFLIAAYKAKFTKAGYEIKIASDGAEALEILKTFTPDIIMLDLIMPNKDGFTVLEELSKDPNLSKIPAIVASNLGQKEDMDKALKLGAKDFVVKSDMSLDQILEKIKKLL